jgi:hypothetical protein
MNDTKQKFPNLSDDGLMLMLFVRPKKLFDPSCWCREMRD